MTNMQGNKPTNLDLRQIGTVMGLPIYVDGASISDYKAENEIASERDIRVMQVASLLQKAFNVPPQPEVKVGDKAIMKGFGPDYPDGTVATIRSIE